MISDFTSAILNYFQHVWDFISTLAWPLAIIFAMLLLAWTLIAVFRPENARTLQEDLSARVRGGMRWFAAGALIVVGFFLAATYPDIVRRYDEMISQREFVSHATGEGGAITQQPPYFAILQHQTLEKKVTIRKPFEGENQDRMIYEIRNAVLQRLQNTGAEADVKVEEKGDSVEVSGKTELLTETRTPLDKSHTTIHLEPITEHGARSNAFRMTYEGLYTWKNTSDAPVMGRFSISLPARIGTYRQFDAEIRGTKIETPDDDGNVRWEGEMAAGEEVSAKIRWQTDASGTLMLIPGSNLRKTKDLRIEIKGPQSLKFARASLQPTDTKGSTRVWQLSDVVTSQPISLAVPFERERKEEREKALYLAPYSVLFLGVFLFIWGRRSFSLGSFAALVGVQSVVHALPVATVGITHTPWVLVVGHLVATVAAFGIWGRGAGVLMLCAAAVSLSAFAGAWTLTIILGATLVAGVVAWKGKG